MAEWKKVVVSGSNVSQLNNDAGYLTTITATNTFATMSINGVAVIADNSVDTLTFESASGAGLNIAGNATTDTITFTLGSIPNTSLTNSTISGVSLGGTLNALTAGSGLTAAGTYTGAAARTFSVDSASMATYFRQDAYASVSGDITINSSGVATIGANSVALGTDTTGDYVATIDAGAGLTGGATSGEGIAHTLAVGAGTYITVNANDVAVNTTTLIPAISGSIQAGISGSLYTGITGDITITSAGVATIGANSVALGTDTTGNYVATLGTGTGVTIGSNTGEGSAPTIAVNYGSTANTAVQGNTTISLTGTTNEVEITGTTAQALGGAPSYTIGLPNDVTIGNNLTVTGDLFVNGTTTTINTADLYVEDKFIVLASGSAAAGDGGIIIDRGSDAQGNIAFGYDAATDRWGYQNGLTDATNAIVIGTDGNSAFAGYVFTEAAHTATKPTTGEFVTAGAIYANTDGTLWMYA